MMTQSTSQPSTASRRPSGALRAGLVAALLAAMALPACGDQQQNTGPKLYQFKLEVSVTDEDENPVPKAPVVLDGKTVGYTDADGEFKAFLTDQEGKKVQIGLGEMDQYILPDDVTHTETLKRTKSLKGKITPVPVSLQATVRSARKSYLMWLEVTCGKYLDASKCHDLPVMYKGKEVARTDAEGRAHFSFEAVPEDTVKVSIHTPKYVPKPGDDDDASFVMKPADPTYDVKLGLDSQVLVLKETFDDPVAAANAKTKKTSHHHRRRRHHHRRHHTSHHSSHHKKKKKKKKKDPGVIQLW